MTCRCNAPAHLDTEFARTMVLYGLPQRRWVCARGHSTTTGVPVIEAKPTTALRTFTCEWCRRDFEVYGNPRRRFCGKACAGQAMGRARRRQFLPRACESCGATFTPAIGFNASFCDGCRVRVAGAVRTRRFGDVALEWSELRPLWGEA